MTVSLVPILVLAALALPGIAVAFGAVRWSRQTRQLRARLEAARVPVQPRTIDFDQLTGLPAPVQAYFRTVLREGRPMVAGVRVHHRGSLNLGDTTARWRPFLSDQRVVTRRPGFHWDARVRMMPGVTVRVHDAYVAGEGVLQAALLGLLPVADLRGSREIAEGELMRFFAEAAWYPTALLPSQGVRWEAVDARSARATLSDDSIALTLLFTFDANGLIDTVGAEARGRRVGEETIATPWRGRFWNYEERDGMRVPLEGEVAWLLPEGPRPYWRGRVAQINYEFAEGRPD